MQLNSLITALSVASLALGHPTTMLVRRQGGGIAGDVSNLMKGIIQTVFAGIRLGGAGGM